MEDGKKRREERTREKIKKVKSGGGNAKKSKNISKYRKKTDRANKNHDRH